MDGSQWHIPTQQTCQKCLLPQMLLQTIIWPGFYGNANTFGVTSLRVPAWNENGRLIGYWLYAHFTWGWTGT